MSCKWQIQNGNIGNFYELIWNHNNTHKNGNDWVNFHCKRKITILVEMIVGSLVACNSSDPFLIGVKLKTQQQKLKKKSFTKQTLQNTLLRSITCKGKFHKAFFLTDS